MKKYIYQVGDEVVHREHTEIKGKITELLTLDEGEPTHHQDINNPWYHIKWNDQGVERIGFEHQDSLRPFVLKSNSDQL